MLGCSPTALIWGDLLQQGSPPGSRLQWPSAAGESPCGKAEAQGSSVGLTNPGAPVDPNTRNPGVGKAGRDPTSLLVRIQLPLRALTVEEEWLRCAVRIVPSHDNN